MRVPYQEYILMSHLNVLKINAVIYGDRFQENIVRRSLVELRELISVILMIFLPNTTNSKS